MNATFFRMPQPETVAGWAEQTPDGFMMSLKAHRIISAWLRNPDKAEPQGFARHLALAQPLIDAGKFAAYPGAVSRQAERGARHRALTGRAARGVGRAAAGCGAAHGT